MKQRQPNKKCAYTYELNKFYPAEIREWPVINGKMPYGHHGATFNCPNIKKFCDGTASWGATPVEAIEKWLKNHEEELIELQREIKIAKKDLEKYRRNEE